MTWRSVSGQSQVRVRSVQGQSQVYLRSLLAYFDQTEPKILRLVLEESVALMHSIFGLV